MLLQPRCCDCRYSYSDGKWSSLSSIGDGVKVRFGHTLTADERTAKVCVIEFTSIL